MPQGESVAVEVVGEVHSKLKPLEFTGNWFIDAGILGFVNLMEEVYGWDLDELQKRIKENTEIVYYGYFPFAYIFRRSIISGIYKQQKALQNITQKAIDKRSKIMEKIEKSEKKLKQETSLKKSSKKIKDLDRVISEINEHISLLNEELPKLKMVFKKRVEDVIKDYKKFIDQYNNEYFCTAEWIDKILPKDYTSHLNKMLIKVLNKADLFKLIRKSKNKNEIKSILDLLPANGNFNIYANANERNFYLYNPIKKDEHTVILYLIALLHEDIEKIKLLMGIKYDQNNPHSLKDKICAFLELCRQYNLDPIEILNYIEYLVSNGASKKVVESLLKEYKIPQSSKKELEKFLLDIYKNFKNIIGRRGQLITYEVIPDSTINPFLFSPGEFPNISYTPLPTTKDLKKLLPNDFPPYILYLTFFDAFFQIYGRGIMFYIPELSSCYSINKRIKIKMELAKGNNRENLNLLKITWSAIIDELVETKGRFSLENMYLIEANIDRNKLNYVEYIGIPKLQASIIIDDTIREALNTNLKTSDKQNISVWLLEEFIKNKPLSPFIINFLHLYLNDKSNWKVSKKTLIYSLAVDSNIKEFSENNRIFGTDFFNKYRDIVFRIKMDAENMFGILNLLKALYDNQENRKRMAMRLLSTVKKNNKYAFSNIFLKILLENRNRLNSNQLKRLNIYLFEKIISNDKNWKNYALAIVYGLANGGDADER